MHGRSSVRRMILRKREKKNKNKNTLNALDERDLYIVEFFLSKSTGEDGKTKKIHSIPIGDKPHTHHGWLGETGRTSRQRWRDSTAYWTWLRTRGGSIYLDMAAARTALSPEKASVDGVVFFSKTLVPTPPAARRCGLLTISFRSFCLFFDRETETHWKSLNSNWTKTLPTQ